MKENSKTPSLFDKAFLRSGILTGVELLVCYTIVGGQSEFTPSLLHIAPINKIAVLCGSPCNRDAIDFLSHLYMASLFARNGNFNTIGLEFSFEILKGDRARQVNKPQHDCVAESDQIA